MTKSTQSSPLNIYLHYFKNKIEENSMKKTVEFVWYHTNFMNIIILTFCYFIYCVLIYIYHIFCIVYSLYQFVNEKVENKIKSKIKSNQNYWKNTHNPWAFIIPPPIDSIINTQLIDLPSSLRHAYKKTTTFFCIFILLFSAFLIPKVCWFPYRI